jgi:hypothetical protein
MDRNLMPFLTPSLVAVSALPTMHDIVWLAMEKRKGNFQWTPEYLKDFSYMNDLKIHTEINLLEENVPSHAELSTCIHTVLSLMLREREQHLLAICKIEHVCKVTS